MSRSSILTAALAVLLFAACGGGGSSAPDSGDVVNCQSDPRVTAYSPNLSEKSSSGGYTFTLVSSSPAPPARDNNTWKMHVTDGSGTAQSNLSVAVQTLMPDHGHRSPVTPTITNNGNGDYTVSPLYFFMPGVWKISFFPSATSSDETDFLFCIPG